jgi:hypothetical protein
VQAVTLPLFGSELGEHPQVRFAEKAELGERFLRIAGLIVTQTIPEVLVVAGEGRALFLCEVASTESHFGFGQMSRDGGERPLPRNGCVIRFVVRDGGDQTRQSHRLLACTAMGFLPSTKERRRATYCESDNDFFRPPGITQ